MFPRAHYCTALLPWSFFSLLLLPYSLLLLYFSIVTPHFILHKHYFSFSPVALQFAYIAYYSSLLISHFSSHSSLLTLRTSQYPCSAYGPLPPILICYRCLCISSSISSWHAIELFILRVRDRSEREPRPWSQNQVRKLSSALIFAFFLFSSVLFIIILSSFCNFGALCFSFL